MILPVILSILILFIVFTILHYVTLADIFYFSIFIFKVIKHIKERKKTGFQRDKVIILYIFCKFSKSRKFMLKIKEFLSINLIMAKISSFPSRQEMAKRRQNKGNARIEYAIPYYAHIAAGFSSLHYSYIKRSISEVVSFHARL